MLVPSQLNHRVEGEIEDGCETGIRTPTKRLRAARSTVKLFRNGDLDGTRTRTVQRDRLAHYSYFCYKASGRGTEPLTRCPLSGWVGRQARVTPQTISSCLCGCVHYTIRSRVMSSNSST